MSTILMVGSEATPFAKTGGLADVLGALPPALVQGGDQVAVLIPRYGQVAVEGADRVFNDLRVYFGPASYSGSVYEIHQRSVRYYLLDIPELYDREGLYGGADGDYPDNHVRFAALCQAALVIARYLFRPQVFHIHDWQTGLLPVYMRNVFSMDPTFFGIKVLLTIHNLGYQGIFAPAAIADLGLDERLCKGGGPLEFYGDVSLLKGGIVYSDAINTVSQAYAREIQTPAYGFRMDGLLRSRSSVLTGIVNGVDYTEWDPAHDSYIAAPYSADKLDGKVECKRDLLREFGLGEDLMGCPVIGIVSRFTSQKGFDLIEGAADELASMDLAIVALGSGEARYEELFLRLAAAYPGRIAVRIAYDNALAHKVEAGSDMFLMPSHYEPCGLNQIYSLRYGTVPIVRATGGLDDTIDESTGFKFHDYSPAVLVSAVRQAVAAFGNKEKWREMMLRGMAKDFSWTSSAARYSELYRSMLAT